MSDLLSKLTPALTTAKSVTGTVEGFDPMNIAITFACDTLGLPEEVKNAAKLAAGISTGNLLLAADGAIGLACNVLDNPPATTELPKEGPGAMAPQGYAYSPPASQPSGSSAVGPKDLEYKKSMEALEHNWDALGSQYSTQLDGVDQTLNEYDLKRIAQSHPNEDLRKAAQFLLDNPEYRQKAFSTHGNAFSCTRAELKAAIFSVEQDIKYGATPGSGQTGGPITGGPGVPEEWTGGPPRIGLPSRQSEMRNSIGSIMNNPSLSMEEKVMLILQLIMEALDQESAKLVGEMGDNALKRVDLEQAAKDAKGDGATKAKKDLASHDSQTDMQNMRLQKTMERRRQMYDLMSTFSTKNNEMSKTAIQNMGRA